MAQMPAAVPTPVRPPGRCLAWLAGAALACGSDEPAPADVLPDAQSSPDAPSLSDATSPPDPLFCEGLDATWEVESLTNAQDGTVRSGPLLVGPDGRADAVGCLPDPAGTGLFDYHLFSRGSEGTWSAPEAIGAEETRCAMSLVAVDETLHAVWVSPPPEADILYKSRSPGGTWSESANLTENLPDFMRMAQGPQLAVSPDGAVSLLWVAQDRPQSIFVARLEDGGISGEPSSVVVTDAADAQCSLEEGVTFDANGGLHAIATCVLGFDSDPDGEHWLTDASGSWTSERVNDAGAFGSIDVDPAGTVHVTWLDNWVCPGDKPCVDPDVYYARRDTEWRDPVLVGPSAYARPAIGVSERAGVLIAFRVRESDQGGIRGTSLVRMDGASSPLCAVPSPPSEIGFIDFAMEIAPDTGLPVVMGLYLPERGLDFGFARLQQ